MTAKEYLNQAYYVDKEITAKIEEIEKLNALATKATTTFSDMPGSPNRDIHKNEKLLVKIIDLENEITDRIDYLIDLKRDIYSVINQVKNPDYKLLLEMRYLCFKKWEEIAIDMHLDLSWIYKIHKRALEAAYSEIGSELLSGTVN